jgi:hypothetical protein
MKPSEDIAINKSMIQAIKNKRKKLLPWRQKKCKIKGTAKTSPKKHIAGKDAASDIPRTSNKDDIAKDLVMTEVDKDNSTAGALSNNNQDKTSDVNF